MHVMTMRVPALVLAIALGTASCNVSCRQSDDPVADALRRLPENFPEIAIVSVQRRDYVVSATYGSPGQPPSLRSRMMLVSVESHDSDEGAEAALARSRRIASGPARSSTIRGIDVTWWQSQRALALVGRHVVTVTALQPAAELLIEPSLERLVPALIAFRPSRPPRPWAIYFEDIVTLQADGPALAPFMGRPLGNPLLRLPRGARYDLNGDGIDDYIVHTREGCGASGCAYAIVDGQSAQVWGRVIGSPLVIRAETTRGLPEIDSYTQTGPDAGVLTTFAFDGRQFAETSRSSVAGPDWSAMLKRLERVPRWRPGR
jgi:hypothetical protein